MFINTQVRHVDIEAELLVEDLEQLVVGRVGHEVDMGPNVGSGDELECQGVSTGQNIIGAAVIYSGGIYIAVFPRDHS
jgi:hypothetical protein